MKHFSFVRNNILTSACLASAFSSCCSLHNWNVVEGFFFTGIPLVGLRTSKVISTLSGIPDDVTPGFPLLWGFSFDFERFSRKDFLFWKHNLSFKYLQPDEFQPLWFAMIKDIENLKKRSEFKSQLRIKTRAYLCF